jgi:sulfur relay protein TusB/DsrH
MKTLLILSKASNRQNGSFMNRILGPDDALVCIQDGVYFPRKKRDELACPVYGLIPDLTARGIKTDYPAISYSDLVDLAFKYERVVTI